jgi:hypothetical protein
LNKNYLFLNTAIALITYSSILIFFIPFYFKIDDELVIWSAKVLLYFSLFQAILSLYQFFIKYRGLNYDAAIGTLGVGGQHELNMKIILPCLISFAFFIGKKKIRYLIFSIILFTSYIISFFNASFLILGLTFLIAILILNFKDIILNKKIKIIRFIMILLIILTMLIVILFGGNLKSTYLYRGTKAGIDQIIDYEKDTGPLKINSYYNTIYFFSKEKAFFPIVGCGIGNYSSRAALYLSGEYSELANKFLPLSKSLYTNKYIISLLKSGKKGTYNQPFSSIQSIYAELGLLGIFLVIFFIFILFRKLKIGILFNKNKNINSIYFVFLIYIIYVSLMLFFDNYLEYPRVMMPLYLFLGILWRNIDNKKIMKFE